MTEYLDTPFLTLVARTQRADAAYIENTANGDVWYYAGDVFQRVAPSALEQALQNLDFIEVGTSHFSMLDALTALNEAAEKYRALQDKQ